MNEAEFLGLVGAGEDGSSVEKSPCVPLSERGIFLLYASMRAIGGEA